MMKILFISNHYTPRIEPNAKRIAGLAENLVKLGHEVSVITAYEKDEIETLNGVRVIRKSTTGKFSSGMVSRLQNHVSFFTKTFFHKHKEEKYDIVIATSPSPFNFISAHSLSKYYRAKYILDIRDIWPDVFIQTGVATKSSLSYRVFNIISNWAYKRADGILTVSPRKVELLKKKSKVDSNKLYLVSNGFDVDFLEQEVDVDFSSEFISNKGDINILYFGNIGIAQDLKPMVKSLKELKHKNIVFHVLGDGNKLQELKEFAEEINFNNIVYYGKRRGSAVYTALKHADISYVSLGSDLLIDSIPTKLYEAIAMGVPVLLTASGDSADLVNASQIGVTLPVSEIDDLPKTIELMIDNLDEYRDNKEFALNYIIENFSRSEITDKLEKILKEI